MQIINCARHHNYVTWNENEGHSIRTVLQTPVDVIILAMNLRGEWGKRLYLMIEHFRTHPKNKDNVTVQNKFQLAK